MNHSPAFGAADLTNCDREPIHIPGSIQPHGVLLALSRADLTVCVAGGATGDLFGVEADALLGRPLSQMIQPGQIERLQRLADQTVPAGPLPQFIVNSPGGQRATDASLHVSGGLLVLEMEPSREDEPEDSLALVQQMIRQIQPAGSLDEFCRAVVATVRAASGFDRVMLYRFQSDESGTVVAEERPGDMEPYLDLHFPASDIPRQARQLYIRNWMRLIPDARYRPAALTPPHNPLDGAPLDLSQSVLRSVSPLHLEYLSNMGVTASMSISLVIGERLWGLVACHHRTPRFLAHRLRVAFELFGQMASFLLETKIAADEFRLRPQRQAIHETLIGRLGEQDDLAAGLTQFRPNLMDFLEADGIGLWVDGTYTAHGHALTRDQAAGLVAWLNANTRDGVFHTDRLSAHYPPAGAFAEKASGLMALSVSRVPRDYVLWFRRELRRTITWAGNPTKAVEADDGSLRLSPRKSFAAWEQQVRDRSLAWSDMDIEMVQALRVSLLEVVLRRIDQQAREREQSRRQQEELLAQLDQRIAQWERTAQQLKEEGDRRAVVEAELSQVLRRTVIDQEEERQRIARELHDTLGQYLTLMQLDIDSIARATSAGADIQSRVSRLRELTATVGHEVNRLAWEIRPTALDDLGLSTALQQYVEEWSERSGIRHDLHLGLNGRRLPGEVESALYRIIQEALTNVVKHADARTVGIIVDASTDEARLIIEDDGKGFHWDDTRGAGLRSRLGLIGVRERLALLDGRLEIETAPGKGTTLLIHVPLRE